MTELNFKYGICHYGITHYFILMVMFSTNILIFVVHSSFVKSYVADPDPAFVQTVSMTTLHCAWLCETTSVCSAFKYNKTECKLYRNTQTSSMGSRNMLMMIKGMYTILFIHPCDPT